MRVLLASSHRFPACSQIGSGLLPKKYPSGSGYHLHDLLAKGLAESGHEVFYFLREGVEAPALPGITFVSELRQDVEIAHAPIGPPGFAESILEFASKHRIPCLLTCHIQGDATGRPNWLFVSRALARAHGSARFVMNGIDPGDFIYSERKEDYFLFIAAMNRVADKGLDVALSVARRKKIRLIVAGTSMTEETIARVAEMCAVPGVEYIGDIRGTKKAELIAGARAILFPSSGNEGAPLVIMEALVSGTPVIARRRAETEEMVTPETGILCDEENDWDDAVDSVHEISPARCREVALTKYHYRRMTDDYLREYEREIGL
jgi:glycosyltransferase involved in cell wall biosynthesis